MSPDRSKPQNYREHLQPCPLVLYIAISEPAILEQLVQNIEIRTDCTRFMAAQLKHRILWSRQHLLLFHRDLNPTYDDGSSSAYWMEEEEEMMPTAQLLSYRGWDGPESKTSENTPSLPNISVLSVSHSTHAKSILVTEQQLNTSARA